jgi:hypothetical protein
MKLVASVQILQVLWAMVVRKGGFGHPEEQN